MKEQINLRVERDFKEVLNGSLRFLSKHARPLLRVIFAVPAPFLLASTFLGIFLFQDTLFGDQDLGSLQPGSAFFSFDLYLGMMLIMMLSYLPAYLLYISVYEYLWVYLNKKQVDISPKIIWKRIFGNFKQHLGIFFMVTLVLVVSALPLLLGFSMMVVSDDAVGGAFLFMMGGGPIWIGLVFVGNLPLVVIQEDISLADVFRRVTEIHKGYWFPTSNLYLVSGFLAWMAGGLFQVPLLVLSLFGDVLGVSGTLGSIYPFLVLVLVGFAIFFQMILFIIPILTTAFQYYSLVEKKWSPGLRERIKLIGEPLPDVSEFEEEEAF